MRPVGRLRRDLGTLEAYASLLGILIGAGIFRVTTESWVLTGPSVILGHAVLAIPVFATSVGYAAFLSTPLGRQPGGEITHLKATFGSDTLAFVAAWLKIIAYVGALAFLSRALADYLVPLLGVDASWSLPLALATLAFFWIVHVLGVRWFGRLQLAMCALLGLSLVVLVVPGLFAVRRENYEPFFTHGTSGFVRSLVPLFFAYAGFEALAQTAGEVRDSTSRLPGVFLRGVIATATIFVLMSIVTFGVLPGSQLSTSTAPMSDVAAVYLPRIGSVFVTLGAVMALATSVNATMLVPSRLGVMLAQGGLVPRWAGHVDPRTSTPALGLTVTFLLAVALLASGQMGLALGIAVQALVVLYFLHSLALLLLPRCNPALAESVTIRLGPATRTAAALVSMLAMGTLITVQVVQDVTVMSSSPTTAPRRWLEAGPTSTELLLAWTIAGLALAVPMRRRRDRERERA